MYVSLLIPVLLSKIPEELTLTISRKFEDTDCWYISFVLPALKGEVLAREKAPSNKNVPLEDPAPAASLHV